MTELLEDAIALVGELPPADQDKAAAALFELPHGQESACRLTDEQVEEVRRTQEGLRNGTVKVLSEDAVDELWRRLGA